MVSVHVRVDDPRSDTVYRYPRGTDFFCKCLCKADNCCLCCGVMHLAGGAHLSPHGGNVYYPALFFVYHMRESGVSEAVNALDVHAEHIVPHFFRNIGKKRLLRNSCIVYKHVDMSEASKDLICGHAGSLAVGNVTSVYFAARFLFKRQSRFLASQIYGGNIIPCLCKFSCTFSAYSP